jgi:hypothetical protein
MASEDQNHLCPRRPCEKLLRVFPLFPKFPPEVQSMIWEFAVANEKSMFLELFIKNDDAERKKELKVRHRTPPLLLVNHEARRSALKQYPKLLGKDNCYLNPRKDVVFMKDKAISKMYDLSLQYKGDSYQREAEKAVRFLVIGGEKSYPSMADLTKCGFRNLEKIILQKQRGALDFEQEAHLNQNKWKPVSDQISPRLWRSTSPGSGHKPELCLLDEDQLNKEVRISNAI